MSNFVRFCENCNKKDPNYEHRIRGRYSTYLDESNYICEVCGNKVIDTSVPSKDYKIFIEISNDPQFIKSMIKLHDTDIIEYNLKLSQFRTQVSQQNQAKQQADNRPHCPKCGSTQITTGARGVNHFWGFIGASKTVNRCGNCGHTWTPKG